MGNDRANENETIDIVLTIDIGAINTRVSLFEKSAGRYQFAGTASGRTVYSDGGEIEYLSVSGAVQKLESAVGRHFLDDNGRIITPQKLGMIGTDQVVVTWSGGEIPRVVLMGLTNGSSVYAMEELLRKNGIRETAKIYDVIMDGRDIGTVVLPDANLKLFITASSEERAKRRLLEFEAAGKPHGDLETVKKEIEERDYRDSHREIAPLKQAEDAVLIDTTMMNLEEVVEKVCGLIQEARK